MKSNHFVKIKLVFLLVFFSIFCFAQQLTIDMSRTYQVIRGFGGMNYPTWIPDLNEDTRKKALGNDPCGIGLSLLRIHVDPDSTNFAKELPTAKYAIQKGVNIFATPWYAPDILTDGSKNPSRVDPSKYNQYVDYLNQFDDYLRRNGVQLYAISIQNEPDYGNWTRWTASEMTNFLKNHGHKINNSRVIAPESFQFVKANYTDLILNDAQAAANIDIVGSHIYGGGLSDYPLARNLGKEVWMTEHTLGADDGNTNNWALAVTLGREINDCMIANYNAYVYWYILQYYGLINNAGNISDKGYVMGQFSKFIRPGSIRVEVTPNPLTNVFVTAYKTDTSFVLVAVNRSTSSVAFPATVVNGALNKLYKFTSSETKKILNEGEVAVSGNTFSVSLDARSVTTFTTHPESGGRYGNLMPTSVAGADLSLINETGDDAVSYSLDGSLSSDADGTITSYSWSMNGNQVALTPKFNAIQTSAGIYRYALTVVDNDGAIATDSVIVNISSPLSTEIWIEAESGIVGRVWQKPTDTNASGSKYIMTTPGIQRLYSASNNSDTIAVYNFNTTEKGVYKIWGRVIAGSADDDSFWFKVDTNSWVNWNQMPSGSAWHWAPFHNQSVNNIMEYQFESGNHTLSVCMREDGAKLDKILIANTGIIPTGLGGNPTGIKALGRNTTTMKVWHDAISGNTSVEWYMGFKVLVIHNLQGELIYSKQFTNPQKVVNIKPNFKAGVYFVKVEINGISAAKKIIVF